MEFRILGPFEVWSDEGRLPLGGSQQRMLLAILLLHRNEVVSIDRLVDELWSGGPPATAVKVVQVYAGTQALGPERLSHDGSLLAVANSGNLGQVTIVRVATGRTIVVLTDHTQVIQDLAFSPDDRLLATASLDGTARIWDAHTGKPLRVLEHPDGVENVAFSPDGRSVATLDFAGVIRIWDACNDCTNPAALMALARTRVTRQLTDDERRTFGVN